MLESESANHKELNDGQKLPTTHVRAAPSQSLFQISTRKSLSLEQLLQLCLRLDQQALWTEFVCRSQPVIASVVTKSVRQWIKPNPALIDDLVQETYLKLCLDNFKALRRFTVRHENALFGFLKVVASNTVQDYFRSSYSQKRGSGAIEAQLDSVVPTCTFNPTTKAVDRGLLLGAISNCLEKFAECPNFVRDQVIFSLYFKHGLTAKAISGLSSIGLSVKGVESTIWRMISSVRRTLNRTTVAATTKSRQRTGFKEKCSETNLSG